MSRFWSEKEDLLLVEHAPAGVDAVSKVLGRSPSAINTRASKRGISLGRTHPTRRLAGPSGLFDRIEPDTNGGCWLWPGHLTSGGYGQTRQAGKAALVHRLSWAAHRGDIPAGAWVLHKCDVRACCNPNHLFLGDAQTNNEDCGDGYIRRSPLPEGDRAEAIGAGHRLLALQLLAQAKANLTGSDTDRATALRSIEMAQQALALPERRERELVEALKLALPILENLDTLPVRGFPALDAVRAALANQEAEKGAEG